MADKQFLLQQLLSRFSIVSLSISFYIENKQPNSVELIYKEYSQYPFLLHRISDYHKSNGIAVVYNMYG